MVAKGSFALDNFYVVKNGFHWQQWQCLILSLSSSVNSKIGNQVTNFWQHKSSHQSRQVWTFPKLCTPLLKTIVNSLPHVCLNGQHGSYFFLWIRQGYWKIKGVLECCSDKQNDSLTLNLKYFCLMKRYNSKYHCLHS